MIDISKALIVIVFLAIGPGLIAINFVCTTESVGIYDYDTDIEMYDEIVFSDYPVMVFSDYGRFLYFAESLENSTSNVTMVYSFNVSSPDVIVIIDQSWLEYNDENETIEGLRELVLQGNPILFLFDSPEFLINVYTDLHVSFGYSHTADVMGIQIPPEGGGNSYGVESDDEGFSLICAYNWAVTKIQS